MVLDRRSEIEADDIVARVAKSECWHVVLETLKDNTSTVVAAARSFLRTIALATKEEVKLKSSFHRAFIAVLTVTFTHFTFSIG